MERTRTSSTTSDILDSIMAQTSYYSTLTHSRESSTASSAASTPLTPAFSSRSHGHWPSSGSSVTSAPDSPIMTKSPLGDLVEEGEEREEFSFQLPIDGALCMCDTAICPHQRRHDYRSMTAPISYMEWEAGDEAPYTNKRRNSGESSIHALANKFNRRFPSISRRWRDSQATTSISNTAVSSSPRRSTSLRLPKVKLSLNSALGPRSRTSFSARHEPAAIEPLDITAPPTPIEEDPVDRATLSRTPLLPPMLHDRVSQSDDQAYLRSPLQSPSVASPSIASSVVQSPVSAPLHGLATPPLSTRPSYASFHHGFHDIPPMDLHQETDPWALKLGHANYNIIPEPYLPQDFTSETCRQLRDQWEQARTEYMRHASHVSETYGPRSGTFKLTEQKWGETDAVWRANYQLAIVNAGEDMVYQPLAITTQHQRMPSLDNPPDADPALPAKFPVPSGDIVGPMVQFAKVQQSPMRKPGLLRIFTDPASILGKNNFSFRK